MVNDNVFLQATQDYEAWLGSIIALDDGELNKKHDLMTKNVFDFFRASFYRWAQLWLEHSSDLGLADAPEVLGIGDLHVENFGTWRDVDGRLAWGVNDFDEACCLPYANDIVRLAVSASIALEIEDEKKNLLRKSYEKTEAGGVIETPIASKRACELILEGYTEGVKAAEELPDARQPFVLADHHGWLRSIVNNKLENPDKKGLIKFNKIVKELSKENLPQLTFLIPTEVHEALLAAFPPPGPSVSHYRVGQREAGVGSLGRQRFTAVVDDWNGGLIAREAKALAPSAWYWAKNERSVRDIWYTTALQEAVRSRDPWTLVYEGWIVRRLSPDAGKIKLDDLSYDLDQKLLKYMGKETANVHSWSRETLTRVAEDLRSRKESDDERNKENEKDRETWFYQAVKRMKKATYEDWESCKKAYPPASKSTNESA